MYKASAKDKLSIALPSKGQLGEASINFLGRAGLRVYKPNQRQYTASIPSIPDVEVIFQRPTDIFHKVNEGAVDIGITGYDIIREYGQDADDVFIIEKLGFGRCELVLAVPESWIDVTTTADLADLAIRYKETGKTLRIATKYRNLTKEWLYDHGISHFLIANADGTLEAAPIMGYADLIADLTETGTTLRENHLRQLIGGTIVESEACIIGNPRVLRESKHKLSLLKQVVELIEANIRSRQYVSIKANLKSESIESMGKLMHGNPLLSGAKGPSITPVTHNPDGDNWYQIDILIEVNQISAITEQIREIGGTDITITQPSYLFLEKSYIYERIEQKLSELY